MLKRFLANKTARNAGWLIGGKVVQMVINLLVGLLTARYLGPSGYGLINYAAAYTGFFTAFCTLGINSVLVKEFVDNRGREGEILGTSLVLRALSSFLSAITIISIVSIVDRNEPTTILVVALCSIGVVFHVFEVFHYWFQSRLASKTSAICTLAAYIVTAAYRVVLLVLGAEVEWFALATSVDYICLAVLLLLAYRKHQGGALRVSLPYARTLLSKSCHFILSSLMVAVYVQTDKIMLKQMVGEAEVGYYATASTTAVVWCFILQAIVDSCYPGIAQAYSSDREEFKRRCRQLYAIIFYVSVTASLLYTLLARPLIRIMYGEAYLPAVAPLRIVTWYTAFSYLGVARNSWVVCENRQRYLKYVYAAAAVANVALNFLLIPPFGAVGAAVASLVAQVVTTMVAPFFIRGMRENSVMMVEAILLRGVFSDKQPKGS